MRLTSPMMAAPVPNLEISAKKASLSTIVRFHRSPCVRGNSGEEGCGQGEFQKKRQVHPILVPAQTMAKSLGSSVCKILYEHSNQTYPANRAIIEGDVEVAIIA